MSLRVSEVGSIQLSSAWELRYLWSQAINCAVLAGQGPAGQRRMRCRVGPYLGMSYSIIRTQSGAMRSRLAMDFSADIKIDLPTSQSRIAMPSVMITGYARPNQPPGPKKVEPPEELPLMAASKAPTIAARIIDPMQPIGKPTHHSTAPPA